MNQKSHRTGASDPITRDQAFGQTYYTEEQVAWLRERHAIAPEVPLRDWLNDLAAIYSSEKGILASGATWREVNNALAKIETLSRQLHERLIHMDHLTGQAFWKADVEASMHIARGEPSPFGHTVEEGKTHEGFQTWTWLQGEQLLEAAGLIRAYAQRGLEEVRQGKPGPRRDHALRLWVSNAHRFWEEQLKRRFTVDVHEGVGFSSAFDFCKDALTLIDPEVSDSKLTNAMRFEIKNENKENR